MAIETHGIGVVESENNPRLGGVDRYYGEQIEANQQNKEGAVGNPLPKATDIPSKNTVVHTTMKGISGVVDSDVQNQLDDRDGVTVDSSAAYFTTPPFKPADKTYINGSTAIRNKAYTQDRKLNVEVNLKENI